MASTLTDSDIEKHLEHLCEIVGKQAKEIVLLQNKLSSSSTEFMEGIKDLELIIRREQIDMHLKISEIKSKVILDLEVEVEKIISKKLQELQISHQTLYREHNQLASDVTELVDCFEKSLKMEDEEATTPALDQNNQHSSTQNQKLAKIGNDIVEIHYKTSNPTSNTPDSLAYFQSELGTMNANILGIKDDVVKIGNASENDYQLLNSKLSRVEEYIGIRYSSNDSIMVNLQNVSKSKRFLDIETNVAEKLQTKVSFDDLSEILKTAVSIESLALVERNVLQLSEKLNLKSDVADTNNVQNTIKDMELSILKKADLNLLAEKEKLIQTRVSMIEESLKDQLLNFKKQCFSKIQILIENFKNRQENYTDVVGIVQENVMNEIGQQLYQISVQVSEIKSLNLSKPIEAIYIWRSGQLFQNCIVWDFETLNSAETLISWNPGSSHIVFSEAGIYSLSMAYFTTHKPLVKVMLNGEKLFTIVNSPTFVIKINTGNRT
eukprot:NODE_429_length_8748_cov_0.280148.p2 type:complete len:493 gc:universal NODE_429_length_8748_cov_0.280148:615-2093(+)